MTLRELRTFQSGDVVRLEGHAENVEIIRQGDMGTTVRKVKSVAVDFDARDGTRVQFKALRGKPIVVAGASLAELKGVK